MEPERHAGQDRNHTVVSMSQANSMLAESLLAVEAQAQTLKDAGALSQAFYHWVLEEDLPRDQITQVAEELCNEIAGGGRSIHAVSALGFLLAIDSVLGTSCRNSFSQGVDWLTGRNGGSQTSMASLMQPLAHTGVLVGLLTVADSE